MEAGQLFEPEVSHVVASCGFPVAGPVGFDGLLCGDVWPFLSWDMLVFLGLVLDPVSSIIMGLVVLPNFAPECLDLYEWERVLDSDGFFSQLSVELFGIVPEGLVLPDEVRPFGVSP